MGGTFNPIHNGHLHIAAEVLNRLSLDQVLFIPTGISPHKDEQDILPACHRLKMVELALSDKPQFSPCDIEIKRAGVSYTVDTVQALRDAHPGDRLFFIIGIDAFSQIKTWTLPEKLLTLCDFAILSRPGFPFSSLPVFGPLASVDRDALRRLDTERRAVYSVETSRETTLHFLNIPPSRISASAIRRDISAGRRPKKRLPDSVESYIIHYNLYLGG